MKKINNFIDKVFNLASGGIYGLISMAIGVSFIFIAMSQSPGFNIAEDTVSSLGIVPRFGGILFNIGLILAGIIAIPFFLYLGRSLKRDGFIDIIRILAVIISIIACISLSMVGCFPAYSGLYSIFHRIFALIFFFTGLIFCILFSFVMWVDPNFSKLQAITRFIVAAIFAIFLITRTALTEWAVFFAIIFWVIENSIYILYKKI